MSKSQKVDLNKLSLDQLADYVKQQQKIQKSKPSPKPVSKPLSKPKISTKLSQLLSSSSGSVLNYPRENVSIALMREEELNMTSIPGKMKMTFAELFDRRLKTMPGKKTRIKITVLAEVRYSLGATSELESKSWGPFKLVFQNYPKRICTNSCCMYCSQMVSMFYLLKQSRRLVLL